jgi:Arc/MetJ family transcription regulator
MPATSDQVRRKMRAEHALTRMHRKAILMHMRTTLILDDDLVARARGVTGVQEKTALVHEGLRALIARESARKLAALGGSETRLRPIARRRARRPAK